MVKKENVTVEELRQRRGEKKYLVDPMYFCGKMPWDMDQTEALQWERECLVQTLRITETPKRRPGILLRINEIDHKFKLEKAKKAYKDSYAEAVSFENEVVSDVAEEEHTFENNEVSESIPPNIEEVNYEEIDHEQILQEFENEVKYDLNDIVEEEIVDYSPDEDGPDEDDDDDIIFASDE